MSLQTNHVAADVSSDVSRLKYLIRSALAGVRTSIPVEVMAVTNNGGVSPIGTVTVRPLVNATDGAAVAWPHAGIANVPYMRIQGGTNAVIIDPQVGDIGVAVVCDRDISGVKNVGAAANPGSTRKHDMSDMVYLMTIIGAAPTQYVQFNSSGINIVSPTAVNIQAPTASVTTTGNVSVTAGGLATVQAASAVIKAASIKLQNVGSSLLALLNSTFATWAATHTHPDAQGGNTGAPNQAIPSSTQTSVVQAE
jgi:hypothetical protein